MSSELMYISTSSEAKKKRIMETFGTQYTYVAGELISDSDEQEVQQNYIDHTYDFRYPLLISQGKARRAMKILSENGQKGFLVSTDSVVACIKKVDELQIYNKPKTVQEAVYMLRTLVESGSLLTLSGIALSHTSVPDVYYCAGMALYVPLLPISAEEISSLVLKNWEKISGSAGAIAMFGAGKELIDMSGQYTGYEFNFTQSMRKIDSGLVSSIYDAEDSLARKFVSGTYPEVTMQLMKQLKEYISDQT